MANLNRVLLIGNLTRDPEVRYTPKGTAVAEIGLAVNRIYSGEDGEKKEETTFVDVTLWARQAEIAGQYLKKGRPVFIEGRLQLDTWDDKQTGQKRSRLRVVSENIQLLGSRQEGDSSSPAPPPRRASAAAPPSRPEPRDPDLDRARAAEPFSPQSLPLLQSYIESQALAEKLLTAGSLGIVYSSVRYSAGKCLGCFRLRWSRCSDPPPLPSPQEMIDKNGLEPESWLSSFGNR